MMWANLINCNSSLSQISQRVVETTVPDVVMWTVKRSRWSLCAVVQLKCHPYPSVTSGMILLTYRRTDRRRERQANRKHCTILVVVVVGDNTTSTVSQTDTAGRLTVIPACQCSAVFMTETMQLGLQSLPDDHLKITCSLRSRYKKKIRNTFTFIIIIINNNNN